MRQLLKGEVELAQTLIITLLITSILLLEVEAIWEGSVTPYLSINYLLPATIIFGALALWLHRDKIISESKSEGEELEEALAEQKRADKFPTKFLRLNKIPLLRSLARWCYKKGLWVTVGLVLIIVMFTAVQAPYFDGPFTGEHTMKYNTYVEPAKYMYERNNPFCMQQKYRADPVNNPEGIFERFESPPIMEWGLLITYYLFPQNSLEFNTRIFTHFIGILILVSAFTFFSKWFSKKAALLITFLLAINPIINFSSFVTVSDSWLALFTFLSLIHLSDYITRRESANLFYAGLFWGIGNSIKYSIFLWLGPITLILLAFHSRKLAAFLKDYSILIFLSLLPLLAFKTSLRNLPSETISSIAVFFIWIIVFVTIFRLLKKYERDLEELATRIVKNKLLFLAVMAAALVAGIAFLYLTGVYKLSSQFLTDSTLIFNWDMYDYMLNEQFKSYMTENVYYLGLIGFVFSLFLGQKNQRIILLSFFAGSLIFWVLASKSIFFHNYYTNIIMVTFALSVGTMFYLIGKTFRSRALLLTTMLLLGIAVFPASYNANTERLSKQIDPSAFAEACNYLREKTSAEEKYIDGEFVLSLTICSERAAIDRDYLDNPVLRESVIKIGFTETMRKYKIKYLITRQGGINYLWFANLYSPDLSSVGYRRSDNILSRLGERQFFEDVEERKEIIAEQDIASKIKLETKIGPYKFYSLY